MYRLIIITFLLLFNLITISGVDNVYAEEGSSNEEISMIRGELRPFPVANLTRISIADPDIVDLADIEDENILLIAKDIGVTAVFIWEEETKKTIMVKVSGQDLVDIKNRITKLLYLAEIDSIDVTVNKKEARVILSGEVHKDKRDLLDDIIIQFEDDIINLTQEERIEDLIQVDMRITELNTSLSKQLGIDWVTGTSSEGTPFQLVYQEDFPDLDGSVSDYFKIGQFSRTSSSILSAQINALIEEGKGKILSEPKLVVKGGEEASFLVGGEIPITTTTVSDGASTEEVEYKQYGVGMTITPEIRNETQIDLLLDVEISDIDASNSTANDVAFVTRTASTSLILENGETNILAGLIRQQESENIRKIPFAHKIPVLGALFRSTRKVTPDLDQELVIAMTPKILAYSKKKQKRMAAANKVKKEKDVLKKKVKSLRSARPYYPGIPKAMHGYIRQVQDKISNAAGYPQEAEIYGWQGTVKLDLLILNDGTLAFAIVKESSGHQLIDEYAVAAAKDIAPFDKFPSEADLQELNVTIPIVYSLNTY